MTKQVLSITQVNEYIRAMMDNDCVLTNLAVRGEISNYKIYPSGHHYFTLKDDNASIKCVMFRSNAVKLKFSPGNGMKIIVMGKISVYPRDGAYQLYCSGMIPDGIGDLYLAFEQLKTKLSSQGLFAIDHKKPLPVYPAIIGIITSAAGAALHDILRIIQKRYPLAEVRLLPVRVQGVEAPGEIVAAIKYANRFQLADVLIVGRGGGSIEDLWAFNDENVAKAIFDSQIPVISAVGHEPDVTISDFVSDARAATPSNAAEIVVPDQDALRQNLDNLSSIMKTALLRQLQASRRQLNILSISPALKSPVEYIRQRRNTFKILSTRLVSAQNSINYKHKQRFISNTSKLDALSPLKVLTRGYSMVQTENGKVVRSVHQVNIGQSIIVSVNDGAINASVLHIKENKDEE